MEPKFEVLAKEEGEAPSVIIAAPREKMITEVAAVRMQEEAVRILEA